MNRGRIGLILGITFIFADATHAEQTLLAPRVEQAPVIDGRGDDPVWSRAPEISTYDQVADIPIKLQAVHDGRRLYLKAGFPDADENRIQKNLVWNNVTELYKTGPKREDTFVIKWSMTDIPIDLSLSANQAYKADIWYWKAHRTDPVGHADDKYQIYSTVPIKKSGRIVAENGEIFYLARRGDAGRSAYESRILIEYEGDEVSGLETRAPRGSRADVRAKGHWEQGRWTVEFARALDTGQTDDRVIGKGEAVQFGVSRYEIAGRKPDPDIEIPLYGSGDISETLFLRLQ